MKRLICAVLLLAALGAGPSAQAALEFCISNDTEFAAAVANAEITPVTMKFVTGTYHTDFTAFEVTPQQTFQGFSLLGGYSANCASRQIDASNTTISSAVTAVFGYMVGDVTVEGIKFVGTYDSGLVLTWNDQFNSVNDSVHVAIRRNDFAGNGDTGKGIRLEWRVGNSHSLSARVVNNLVHGHREGGGYCAVDFQTDPDVDASFTLINNTVVDNSADLGAVCLRDGGSLFADNNIFYGTRTFDDTAPSDDLYSATSSLFLVDNLIGHHTYPAPVVPPVGTQTGDPQLQANLRPIEAPLSPVINTGSNSVPGGLPTNDYGGGPRLIGSAVDRGAYESSIDDAFIQTVSNSNDTGMGSLRAAINNINANGSGLIKFALPGGCGPQVITLGSLLPAIDAGAIINGFSQSGSAPNDLDIGNDAVLCVILEAGNGNVTSGLRVLSGAGDSAQVLVKGLAFSGFSDAALDFDGGSNHEVAGNHFGGSVGGHALQPNHINIRFGIAAHDSLVGGDDVAARNLIGDAMLVGEEPGDAILLLGGASGQIVLGSYNNQIVNNLIGLGWSTNAGAYTNRGNSNSGVHIQGHDNVVRDNVIGDNGGAGVYLDREGAVNNLVDGNLLGTTEFGANVGNSGAGVQVGGNSRDSNIRFNTVTNNTWGVVVSSGIHNKIRRNAIYNNIDLGIDLAALGITSNDDDGGLQQIGYANRGQNFPLLSSARGSAHSGAVNGSLTSTGGDYTIDLYASPSCDDSGNGEGKSWLRSVSVTIPTPQVGHQANVTFSISFSAPSLTLDNGSAITATATDSAGDTSEFSACQTYQATELFSDSFESPPA